MSVGKIADGLSPWATQGLNYSRCEAADTERLEVSGECLPLPLVTTATRDIPSFIGPG